jgi:ribosomal protein S18 acetylase RimI-like enzyme
MVAAEIFIRDATPDDAAPLARFTIDVCARPESHCLQSWSGESDVASESDLREALEGGARYCMALQGNRLVGALGCRLDAERGLLWLEGPLLAEPDPHVATNLWRQLTTRVPRDLRVARALVNQRNEFARQFWGERGLTEQQVSHVFQWLPDPDGWVPAPALRLHDLSAATAHSMHELHSSMFPASYLRLSELLEPEAALWCLCVLAEGGRIDGFVTFGLEEDGEGRVYTLGVHEGLRRQGVGRQLLMGAMARLLDAKAARVLLSVRDADAAARRLYESVGFTLRYSGVALRGKPLF